MRVKRKVTKVTNNAILSFINNRICILKEISAINFQVYLYRVLIKKLNFFLLKIFVDQYKSISDVVYVIMKIFMNIFYLFILVKC